MRSARFDFDHDGNMEMDFIYSNDVLIAFHEDRNSDGKLDGTHSFRNGLFAQGRHDSDFDGTLDTFVSYSNGVVERVAHDVDNDHCIDLIEFYKYGWLWQADWISRGIYTGEDSDRRASSPVLPYRRVSYRRGIKTRELIDVDTNRTFDIKIDYDIYERPIPSGS